MEHIGLSTGVIATSIKNNYFRQDVQTKGNGTIRNPYEQRLVPLQRESVFQSGVQETLPHHDYPEAEFRDPSQYELQRTI